MTGWIVLAIILVVMTLVWRALTKDIDDGEDDG